jgi:hypothetical protein
MHLILCAYFTRESEVCSIPESNSKKMHALGGA